MEAYRSRAEHGHPRSGCLTSRDAADDAADARYAQQRRGVVAQAASTRRAAPGYGPCVLAEQAGAPEGHGIADEADSVSIPVSSSFSGIHMLTIDVYGPDSLQPGLYL